MAIKWGSTYVTAVKWGNTTCTAVYWGGTKVFPVGGYDGSSFSYPLIGGFDSNSYFPTASVAQTIKKNSSLTMYLSDSKNKSINFSLFNTVTLTFTETITGGGSYSHDIWYNLKIGGSSAGSTGNCHTSTSPSTYTRSINISSYTNTTYCSFECVVQNNSYGYVECNITIKSIIFS